jgi:hypothetical protein
VAEIKFRDIAVKVLLFAVLIDALHAAFEHAVVAFRRVDIDLGSGRAIGVAPFLAPMIDRVVLSEMLA